MEFIAPIVVVSLDLSAHFDVAECIKWVVVVVVLLRS